MGQQRTDDEIEREGIHLAWEHIKGGWRFDSACKGTVPIAGPSRSYLVDFEQQFGEIDGKHVARVIGKIRDGDLQIEFGPFDVTAAAPAQPAPGCSASD